MYLKALSKKEAKFLLFLRLWRSQMVPQLALHSVQVHTCPQQSRQCHEPDNNLEKNLDPPIINPIIRESSLILEAQSNLSDPAHIGAIKVGNLSKS